MTEVKHSWQRLPVREISEISVMLCPDKGMLGSRTRNKARDASVGLADQLLGCWQATTDLMPPA